ncbi:MAG TPA: ParB/RepB/Spo0J family partition protein [Candidatus Limnocylindrales bacterium]|nr:ParB/RepB/Spo0J family partition protein [Candidatus Limnocylindrales bacterium]
MDTVTAPADRVERIPITLLDPSPLNPRKRFETAYLEDLKRSIESHKGVLVPMLGRPGKKGRVEIVDGERRFRALQDLAKVTNGEYGEAFRSALVVVRELTDGEVLEIQLVSAIQRQDLTPLEEARGYRDLIKSNPSRYSAAYIADKIGRSEKYVHDRMKLLDLIPVLQKLLDAERILVGHAELLAKLKPEDQERALDVPDRFNRGKGLWQDEHARLAIDDDEDGEPTAKNLYRGLKPVTVKELESWIAHHVRFDVEHMAAAAPLDFAAVKQEVDAAKAEPGRGKKVIAITHEYRVSDDARDDKERTFGRESWERADGKDGSKICDHSVLGVFVAGPGQGTTLRVCVNRDKCLVHWGKVIRDREKNQKLRVQGKGGQANQREAATEAKRREEAAARQRAQEAWKKLEPLIEAAAISQIKSIKALTSAQARWIFDDASLDLYSSVTTLKKHLGSDWHKNLAAGLMVLAIEGGYYESFDEFVKDTAKPLGLDIKKLEAVRDKHAPNPGPETAAAPAKKVAKARTR